MLIKNVRFNLEIQHYNRCSTQRNDKESSESIRIKKLKTNTEENFYKNYEIRYNLISKQFKNWFY